MNITLSTLDKATRKEAYDMVFRMKMGEEISDSEIDHLLNFFAPAMPKKAKSAEQWVGLACDAKDRREFCRYIHVKNGVATATDGHRMHWTDTYLPDGTYDPKTQLLVNFKGILPELERIKLSRSDHDLEFKIMDVEVGQLPSAKGMPTPFTQFGKYGAIMSRYLEAASCGDKELSVFVDSKKGDGCCSGVSEYGQYYIMGMRI